MTYARDICTKILNWHYLCIFLPNPAKASGYSRIFAAIFAEFEKNATFRPELEPELNSGTALVIFITSASLQIVHILITVSVVIIKRYTRAGYVNLFGQLVYIACGQHCL